MTGSGNNNRFLFEDDRIQAIGNYVRDHPGEKVGVVVDDKEGVLERYIFKLTTEFTCVEVLKSMKGPHYGMCTLILKKKGIPLKKDN